jgi:hypothetical protein
MLTDAVFAERRRRGVAQFGDQQNACTVSISSVLMSSSTYVITVMNKDKIQKG